MTENKKRVGLLFGAGAELYYGLPTGAELALEIFLNNNIPENSIKPVKTQIERIENDKDSEYREWLPEHIGRYSNFTSATFQNIIETNLNKNRDIIIKKTNENFIIKLKEAIGIDIEQTFESTYGNNKGISENGAFFKTIVEKNISCIRELVNIAYVLNAEKENVESNSNEDYGHFIKIIKTMFQIILFAHGNKHVDSLNNNLGIDGWLIEDIDEVFSVKGKGIGHKVWTLAKEIKEKYNEKPNCDKINDLFLEYISPLFDYRQLIDKYWHYLYDPKSDWAKFCKISSLLFSTSNVFEKYRNNDSKQCEHNSKYRDYYKEIKESKNITISRVATTNYTDLAKGCVPAESNAKSIVHLNGNLEEVYDPYKNEILNKENATERFVVPWIYTQSGTKPFTDFNRMCQYQELYDDWSKDKTDVIVVIGYGFNTDDYHVNSILRKLLIEEEQKLVIIMGEKEIQDKKAYKALGINDKNSEMGKQVRIIDYAKLDGNWIDYILTSL